ncbi:hypothetical protein PENSPDRAFT_667025 [Peniophora sp. CONT]|nr:hypothetical protein PENSPDRAFT_667025 [Peniophora sp. CONT]
MDSVHNSRIKEILNDSSCVREYIYAIERLFTQTLDKTAAIQPVHHFANSDLSATTPVLTPNADGGLVLFVRKTASESVEQEYSDIGFVRDVYMSSIRDRPYVSPETLYSSLSIVSPPGGKHSQESKHGITNLYRRMSTQSSSRTFSPIPNKPWTTDTQFANANELYLTNFVFTRRHAHAKGLALGQIIPEGPPPSTDPNGAMRKILARRLDLCYTTDNQTHVSEHILSDPVDPETNSETSGSVELRGDSIVPGQLVFVTFNLRGIPQVHKSRGKKTKRGGNESSHPFTSQTYHFRPILRGPFILSNPLPTSSLSLTANVSTSSVALGPRSPSANRAIETALKRLRVSDVGDNGEDITDQEAYRTRPRKDGLLLVSEFDFPKLEVDGGWKSTFAMSHNLACEEAHGLMTD